MSGVVFREFIFSVAISVIIAKPPLWCKCKNKGEWRAKMVLYEKLKIKRTVNKCSNEY